MQKHTKRCKQEKLIILSPYDLYVIAKKLDITFSELVDEYCKKIIGEGSKIPLVAIETQKCPFLQGGRCIAEKEKPFKCKIYPLKNGINIKSEVFYTDSSKKGKKGQKGSAEKWLKKNGVTDDEEMYEKEWYELTSEIVKFIYTKIHSYEEFVLFQSALAFMLYLTYDTQKDFYSQFKEQAQSIKTYMQSLEKEYDTLDDKN